jgi:arylsulfatase A-like enzyme
MHPDEVTLAEVFSQARYATGIFGKWHLGDNFPCRPQDQGFEEVVVHGGGGVTQTPDYWGNDYFGDTYLHNGVPKKFEKYCTDVWFDEAMKFIERNKDRPFLAYIPTNAPHSPYLVDEKYSKPYEQMGLPPQRARFYGMITNIDENIGRLDQKLAELGLKENTILIFTTDNGTAAGAQNGGFNAGMRGQKGSEYEGGHRVPFFIRWPKGNIGGGRDVPHLTAHIDVLPTLAELCGFGFGSEWKLDGKSLVPLLTRPDIGIGEWPDRTLFVHSQRLETPQKWRKAAVMTERWRFVCDGDRRELFHIQGDPGQKTDVAKDHPEVFRRLTAEYEAWYESISTRFDDYVRITLGDEKENPVHLTCHDWHTDDAPVPWSQQAVSKNPKNNGFWAVDIKEAGEYEITLRMRPHYVKDPPKLNAASARIKLGRQEVVQVVDPEATSVTMFKARLDEGPARFETWLETPGEKPRGAYFVDVKWLGK